jgi:hypothetical protein
MSFSLSLTSSFGRPVVMIGCVRWSLAGPRRHREDGGLAYGRSRTLL